MTAADAGIQANGRIGIFGGMFDPVHSGHLRAAIVARETLELDELRFLPCARPAHRVSPMADNAHRLAMLERAIAEQSGLGIDDRELRRPGTSYLVDTLESFRDEMPARQRYFLLGSDAFSYLDHWHRWHELLTLSHWVIVPRPGWELALSDQLRREYEDRRVEAIEDLHRGETGRIWVSEPCELELSSTRIRDLIAEGRSLRYLLPDPVIEYIHRQQLYRNTE